MCVCVCERPCGWAYVRDRRVFLVTRRARRCFYDTNPEQILSLPNNALFFSFFFLFGGCYWDTPIEGLVSLRACCFFSAIEVVLYYTFNISFVFSFQNRVVNLLTESIVDDYLNRYIFDLPKPCGYT